VGSARPAELDAVPDSVPVRDPAGASTRRSIGFSGLERLQLPSSHGNVTSANFAADV
jgi:hypothetical protein